MMIEDFLMRLKLNMSVLMFAILIIFSTVGNSFSADPDININDSAANDLKYLLEKHPDELFTELAYRSENSKTFRRRLGTALRRFAPLIAMLSGFCLSFIIAQRQSRFNTEDRFNAVSRGLFSFGGPDWVRDNFRVIECLIEERCFDGITRCICAILAIYGLCELGGCLLEENSD
jgi:hypothetical protein